MATSLSCKNPSHLLTPERQKGTASARAQNELGKRRLGNGAYSGVSARDEPAYSALIVPAVLPLNGQVFSLPGLLP